MPATPGWAASAAIRLTSAVNRSLPAFQSSASSVFSHTRSPAALAAASALPSAVCAAARTSSAPTRSFEGSTKHSPPGGSHSGGTVGST